MLPQRLRATTQPSASIQYVTSREHTPPQHTTPLPETKVMMNTMQAWRMHTYGGPSVLRLDTVPIPTPGPGQIQIRISKAGLNPFDWKLRDGHMRGVLPLPLPKILGVDFVGTVSALADGTSAFRVGERVMGFTETLEAFAEYKVVDADALARVPERLADEEAMTLPIPALTAWQALHTAGPLAAGMRVLIQGASGVVGALAVQFAKAARCYVVAVASGKNRGFVEGLGSDRFVDYERERFEEVVGEVDLVLDCILVGGSDGTTDRSWGVVREGGAIVSVADPGLIGAVPEGKKGYFPRILPDGERLQALGEMLAAGEIETTVAKVFSRDELVEGMELNKNGGLTGRLMVDFKDA